MSLGKELDGAKIFKYDPASELTFAWYGGQSMGIRGYDANGKEVVYWTMGGCASDHATSEEVNASIQSHIDSQYFPD
jgi:hypothetical protein